MRFLKKKDLNKFAQDMANDFGEGHFGYHNFEVKSWEIEEVEYHDEEETLIEGVSLHMEVFNADMHFDDYCHTIMGGSRTFSSDTFGTWYKYYNKQEDVA
jgi:hypothetical protein